MSDTPLRILGFPLHVRPGFLLFMLLIVAVNPGEVGVWLAASVAGFTLVHELGHAVAARWAGAKAEISLDFLAGYASYVPSRPLKRWERAAIAFAGPGVHITVSCIVFVLLGGDLFDLNAVNDTASHLAVFWAGPMIGLFNLLPILPLDGGNIVEAGLDKLIPGRAEQVMVYGSIAFTLAAVLWMALDEDRQRFIVFAAVVLIMQFQMLYSPGRRPDPVWERAQRQLQQGNPDRARRTIERAVTQPGAAMPMPPNELTREELAALVRLFDSNLPTGNPGSEYVLANVLLVLGDYERAAFYAADAYGRSRSAPVASIVARAANAVGDPTTAISWLRTAALTAQPPELLASIIDRAPELGSLRTHPDVIALRQSLAFQASQPPPFAS